jgi:hypothetical protein
MISVGSTGISDSSIGTVLKESHPINQRYNLQFCTVRNLFLSKPPQPEDRRPHEREEEKTRDCENLLRHVASGNNGLQHFVNKFISLD